MQAAARADARKYLDICCSVRSDIALIAVRRVICFERVVVVRLHFCCPRFRLPSRLASSFGTSICAICSRAGIGYQACYSACCYSTGSVRVSYAIRSPSRVCCSAS
jgi:hypothetical protein